MDQMGSMLINAPPFQTERNLDNKRDLPRQKCNCVDLWMYVLK